MQHRLSRYLSLTSCLASIALLAACAVGKDYKAPEVTLKPAWCTIDDAKTNNSIEVTPITGEEPAAFWWQLFNDDILSGLIDKALEGNNDLKIAESRIIEARADERFAFSAFLPQVEATANSSRNKEPGPFGGTLDSTSQAGVSGAWELDFFGANIRRTQAANAGIEAAEAERNQTRIALIAEVARNYVRLRAAQAQYEIVERNLAKQLETLQTTTGQRQEGAISDLDVVRAQAQVDSTNARLPQLKTVIASLRNRLNILTGAEPGTLDELLKEAKPIPALPVELVIATPVQAIAQRPDVKTAERRLAQASALSAAAFADFFPKLSLQGFFGIQHSELYGRTDPWSAAANAALPILNFGKLTSQADAAEAREQQALLSYKQTVLLALEEVENNLSSYLNEIKRRQSLVSVATHQIKAAEIAREQYKAGIIGQIDLLVAEQNRLDSENDVVLSEQNAAESLILLYRALGERPNEEPKAEPAPSVLNVPEASPSFETLPLSLLNPFPRYNK